MRYEPTTVVVTGDGAKATAWPGGLSVEALQQALRVSGK